jgi:hypothetical protein
MTQTGTGKYERLLERCRGIDAIPTSVRLSTVRNRRWPARWTRANRPDCSHPCWTCRDDRICRESERPDLGKTQIVDVPDSRAAAAKAVELVRTGKAELVMKGSLHSDELLGRGDCQRNGIANRPPAEPRVPDGRADVPQAVSSSPTRRLTSRRRSKTRTDICQNAIRPVPDVRRGEAEGSRFWPPVER